MIRTTQIVTMIDIIGTSITRSATTRIATTKIDTIRTVIIKIMTIVRADAVIGAVGQFALNLGSPATVFVGTHVIGTKTIITAINTQP